MICHWLTKYYYVSVKVTKCQAYVTQKQTMSFGQVSEVFILYNLISLLLYGHNDKKLHLWNIDF